MRWAFLAAAMAAGLGMAAAQEPSALTADATRAAIIGVDMRGVIEGEEALRWRECIAPNGETVYAVEGETPDLGRLEVRADGAACFRYASSGYQAEACWFVFREADGRLRFENEEGWGPRFFAERVRPARTCAHIGASS